MVQKRQRTPAQLANDERLRNNSKQASAEGTPPSQPIAEVPPAQEIGTQPENSTSTEQELRNQVNELKAMMLDVLSGKTAQVQSTNNVQVGQNGKLIGEIDKYALDPANYSNPIERLSQEPRLQAMAFNLNYELEYEMSTTHYETKTGVNQREPEFLVTLLRVVLDDQGYPTDKRYIARRMVFHEDPQAAIVIAREQGIALDDYKDLDNTDENQKLFLNEMRYLRVKTWLFDIFWPRPASSKDGIKEEVISGSIVQVFTKSSEEPSGVDFDQIKTVMR